MLDQRLPEPQHAAIVVADAIAVLMPQSRVPSLPRMEAGLVPCLPRHRLPPNRRRGALATGREVAARAPPSAQLRHARPGDHRLPPPPKALRLLEPPPGRRLRFSLSKVAWRSTTSGSSPTEACLSAKTLSRILCRSASASCSLSRDSRWTCPMPARRPEQRTDGALKVGELGRLRRVLHQRRMRKRDDRPAASLLFALRPTGLCRRLGGSSAGAKPSSSREQGADWVRAAALGGARAALIALLPRRKQRRHARRRREPTAGRGGRRLLSGREVASVA